MMASLWVVEERLVRAATSVLGHCMTIKQVTEKNKRCFMALYNLMRNTEENERMYVTLGWGGVEGGGV